MGDFPPQWTWVRDLPEGGQAHTFVVRRSGGSADSALFALKRLKNPKREDYFEREIRACETMEHPNVLKVLEHGRTPRGRPFLVTEYCSEGSLQERRPQFDTPVIGLRFFRQIVAGVAHAHAQEHAIYHLDLKPGNILLKNNVPVVGDFGICFIEGDEVSITKEGPRGSLYYCAPEFRNPKLSGSVHPAPADVYSLGKILYWLYTGDVYDGHEEDYCNEASQRLAHRFPSYPQFAFVDELVSETVQRNPARRSASAGDFERHVQGVIDRIEAGGRVLDLRIPQRCLFCGTGEYQVLVMPPPAEQRIARPDATVPTSLWPDIYANMREQTTMSLGQASAGGGPKTPVPLHLICDYCGNIQQFRIDRVPEALKRWMP